MSLSLPACVQETRNRSSQWSTLRSGFSIDGVQPQAPSGRTVQAGLPQHPQVCEAGRLADPELGPDHRTDRAGGMLTVGEQSSIRRRTGSPRRRTAGTGTACSMHLYKSTLMSRRQAHTAAGTAPGPRSVPRAARAAGAHRRPMIHESARSTHLPPYTESVADGGCDGRPVCDGGAAPPGAAAIADEQHAQCRSQHKTCDMDVSTPRRTPRPPSFLRRTLPKS